MAVEEGTGTEFLTATVVEGSASKLRQRKDKHVSGGPSMLSVQENTRVDHSEGAKAWSGNQPWTNFEKRPDTCPPIH